MRINLEDDYWKNSAVVKLENSDGKIWNLEDKIIEIISAMLTHGSVVIWLNGEGPCLDSLGLITLLEKICSKFSFDKSKILIDVCNLIQKPAPFTLQINGLGMVELVKINQTKLLPSKNIQKYFGFFIGRSNWNRLWLGTRLHFQYQDKTLMSFHYDNSSDFHKEHVGLDELFSQTEDKELLVDATKFLNKCPIIPFGKPATYPILIDQNMSILEQYSKIFLDLVCETYTSGHTFFPTEKTWRPIKAKTPFIVNGPVDFLKNLKKAGFKTFDRWWSEEYDSYDGRMRILEIENLLLHISYKSLEELVQIYSDMQSVLDHNYYLLENMTSLKLRNIFRDQSQ